MMTTIDTARWMEPKPAMVDTSMPCSCELLRVVHVESLDGANTKCVCVTHHGREFRCTWGWLIKYWEYAPEAAW